MRIDCSVVSKISLHTPTKVRPQNDVAEGKTYTKYRNPLYYLILRLSIYFHICSIFHHIMVRKTRGFHVHLPFAPEHFADSTCYIPLFYHSSTGNSLPFYPSPKLAPHLLYLLGVPRTITKAQSNPSNSNVSTPSLKIIVNYHFICKFCANTRITIILQNEQKRGRNS